jgi:hypothetical protein
LRICHIEHLAAIPGATLTHFAGDLEVGGFRVAGGRRRWQGSLGGLSNRTKNRLLIALTPVSGVRV